MLCVQQPAASEENRANVLGTCGQRERGPGGKQCFLLAVVYARVRQGICWCFLLESPGTAVVYVRVKQGISACFCWGLQELLWSTPEWIRNLLLFCAWISRNCCGLCQSETRNLWVFLLESPGTAVVYVRVRQGICEGFFCFVLFLLESPGTAVVYARVKTFLWCIKEIVVAYMRY